jgi:hypothetical protein
MRDTIDMALEAGFKEHNGLIYVTTINDDCAKELERFAELVRADAIAGEREACAKVCEQQSLLQLDERVMRGIDACAAAIRARGESRDHDRYESNIGYMFGDKR